MIDPTAEFPKPVPAPVKVYPGSGNGKAKGFGKAPQGSAALPPGFGMPPMQGVEVNAAGLIHPLRARWRVLPVVANPIPWQTPKLLHFPVLAGFNSARTPPPPNPPAPKMVPPFPSITVNGSPSWKVVTPETVHPPNT